MISDRREYFNDSVNLYNTGIEVFPDDFRQNDEASKNGNAEIYRAGKRI